MFQFRVVNENVGADEDRKYEAEYQEEDEGRYVKWRGSRQVLKVESANGIAVVEEGERQYADDIQMFFLDAFVMTGEFSIMEER